MMYFKPGLAATPFLRLLCTGFFLFAFGTLWAQKQFSKKQVLEDLEFLKTSLEETHYDLYAYTPKQEFLKNFNEVTASVTKDSLSLLEATSLFQQVITKANNGHTEIIFPISSYIEYALGGGTVFPLEVAFESGKALVRKNWSANPTISAGDEILSIEGRPMEDILAAIAPHISAERPYFKKAKIEFYSLPRLYWQVFGKRDSFMVEIGTKKGVERISLRAVAVIDGYESKREDILNAKMRLKLYGSSAYLDPGGFGGDLEAYKRFVDSAFAEIRAKHSRNLILDLRNHPGGDDAFGDYLVSYFADKPFAWNSSFRLKTSALLKADARNRMDTTRTYWQQVLSHEDGERYDFEFEKYQPQPQDKRFTGKVYVLVNRQSHSQSAVTAAQIQDYGFGTIVGEETGDYPSLYASVFRYPLPNTGVSVQVSKGRIIRVNGSTKEEGVIPDIVIKDHLLDEKDEVLEGLLQKLSTDRDTTPR